MERLPPHRTRHDTRPVSDGDDDDARGSARASLSVASAAPLTDAVGATDTANATSRTGVTDDAIETHAATWFVSRQRAITANEDRAFRAWLARSPSHEIAYAHIAGVWGELGALPQAEIARLRATNSANPIAARNSARHTLASPGRRAFVPRFALASAAFAVAGGGVFAWNHWQNSPTFTQAWQTARGEFLTVALPDGSTLNLDTDTHVEATLFHTRREVTLRRGQAMFAVRSDPGCPFEVFARNVTVTVVGTRFSVRCTDSGVEHGNVRVAVEEGRVRVDATQPDGIASRVVELASGETVATDATGQLAAVSSIASNEVAPWRQGRVTFDNTTLLRALQEFERYGETGVVLGDPTVGTLRVTGSFDVREASRFVHALPRVLPVRIRPRGKQVEIVRIT